MALARHTPARLIWIDAAGETRFVCLGEEVNRDCVGCREQRRPEPGNPAWVYTPPGIAGSTATG